MFNWHILCEIHCYLQQGVTVLLPCNNNAGLIATKGNKNQPAFLAISGTFVHH